MLQISSKGASMKVRGALLAVALIGAPLHMQAARAAPGTALQDPVLKKSLCDQIVLLIAPDKDVSAQVDKYLDASLKAMVRDDPAIAALERNYPGMIEAMRAAWRPVFFKAAAATLPLYRAELSQFYQDNLTIAEARQVLAFFQTPEFQAFIAMGRENMDYRQTTKNLTDDKDVSVQAVRSDLAAAGVKTAKQLSPIQRRKLMAFFSSPTGQKLLALNPKKLALEAKWTNYVSPESEREIELVTYETMIGHIAKTDPETANLMRKELERQGLLPKKP